MELRKLIAFGTGAGIEIRRQDLAITLARVRPAGVEVIAFTTLANFRERPAAEWGAEYARFLKAHGVSHLAATIVLPRREVIVRLITLPKVGGKDLEAAVGFQIESLHPYGEEDVEWGYQRLGAAGAVLVGMVRKSVLAAYHDRFVEAGLKVASFTFSAATLHGAIRVPAPPPAAGLLGCGFTESGEVEVYGESPARPLFSAELDLPLDRAAALARSELRLDDTAEALPFAQILPQPVRAPQDFDLARHTVPYAGAISGANPWIAPAANLLPAAQRVTHSRAVFLPSAILAVLLLLTGGALWGYQLYNQRQHLRSLRQEIGRVEPLAKQAAALDQAVLAAQNRERVLDEFRSRAKADLDALQELTRILEPPVWVSSIQLTRDSVLLSGEAEQAATLLKILDSSPFFQRSAFALAIVRGQTSENFRIRTEREARPLAAILAAAPAPAVAKPQPANQPALAPAPAAPAKPQPAAQPPAGGVK